MLKSLVVAGLLTIKVAAMYVDEKDCFKVNSCNKVLRPTVRLRWTLCPKSKMKLTIAASEMSREGVVKPLGVVTLWD